MLLTFCQNWPDIYLSFMSRGILPFPGVASSLFDWTLSASLWLLWKIVGRCSCPRAAFVECRKLLPDSRLYWIMVAAIATNLWLIMPAKSLWEPLLPERMGDSLCIPWIIVLGTPGQFCSCPSCGNFACDLHSIGRSDVSQCSLELVNYLLLY